MENSPSHGLSPVYKGIVWGISYTLLVILPLLFLIIDNRPSAIAFWWDFSIALGLGAVALIHMMSVLTARIRFISGPFGIDVIYYFHRQIAFVIFFLIISHPVILLLYEPLLVYEFEWPVSVTIITGMSALAIIIAQVLLSIGKEWLNLEYDNWRRIHAVFGALALFSALAHMASVGYYSDAQGQFILWSVYAAVWILSLVYVHVIKPVEQLRKPYQVMNIKKESDNAWTLNVQPKGHSGMIFQAGQFAWLSANNSSFSFTEHPFSFSSSAVQKDISFAIKEVGDFSSSIKDLKTGQKVYLDGPHGVFTIDRYQAPGYVFIAGGIGVAPVMSMLRTMADRNDEHPLLLIYGNKSPGVEIFHNEIESLKQKLNLEVVYVYSMPHPDWDGETGIISEELVCRYINEHHKQYHFFNCGPSSMMETVEKSLVKIGIPYNHIHYELFNLV